MKWKKILKDSRWGYKNGLNESFKMSPHLICLNWRFNFHITSRPDPEAGHKRDLWPQLRHIKWGLILKLSMRLFSRHSPKSLRRFFHFESLSRSVPGSWRYFVHKHLNCQRLQLFLWGRGTLTAKFVYCHWCLELNGSCLSQGEISSQEGP